MEGLFRIILCILTATGITANSISSLRFISKSQVFRVERWRNITFPCQVQDIGDNVMTFKYVPSSSMGRERLYFAGDIEVYNNPRLQKKGQFYLLSRVRRTDSGTYICRVESEKPLELRHSVDILYPAKILRSNLEEFRVVKGSIVSLPCSVEGNPKPHIVWRKEGGMMPNGELSAEAKEGTLLLQNISSEVEGKYSCTATNGVGPPDSYDVTVVVEYKPEVSILKAMQHTAPGDNIKMECIVSGKPKPAVSWLRGDDLLSSNNHNTSVEGERKHVLNMFNVREEDLGNYTCSARNVHGRVESSLVLTGVPTDPEIISGEFGRYTNWYLLRWRVESPSRVLQYRISFRHHRGLDNDARNNWQDSLHSSSPVYNNNNHEYYPKPLQKNSNESHFEKRWFKTRSPWTYVPSSPIPTEGTLYNYRLLTVPDIMNRVRRSESISGKSRTMRHKIKNLMADTSYQVKVAVENKYGWSSQSNVFTFHTAPGYKLAKTTLDDDFDSIPQVREMSAGEVSGASCIFYSSYLRYLEVCLIHLHSIYLLFVSL